MITHGSLFSGFGGFDLGFERAGMETVWQVENDEYARRVLRKHWRCQLEGDIRECGKHNLARCDVISAGFPCQDISYAGLGAGLDGERSGLFYEAIRVVRELQPKVVVLENVAALLTRGLDRVLGTLASIGFDAEWHCIPAASFGAPHIRERIFVVAYSNPDRGRLPIIRKRSIEEIAKFKASYGRNFNGLCKDATDSNLSGLSFSECEISEGENGKQSRGAIAKCNWWTTEPNVGRVANGISNRVDRLRGLGNAVVPQKTEWIGLQIAHYLRG